MKQNENEIEGRNNRWKRKSYHERDRNRNKNQINVKNEETGHKILDEMYRRAPYFFSGFTNDLADATDNGRFNSLIQAVDERREHVLSSEMPGFGETIDNNSTYKSL